MKKIVFKTVVVVVFALLVVGCGSYYKVTEPSSDKVYYTKEIDKNRSGSIVFKDEATGSEVTLQNSEIMEIDKEEFKSKTVSP